MVAVLSSDLEAYRTSLAAFEEAFGSTVTVLPPAARARIGPETRVVVAFGSRAARRRYPEHAVVVQVLAPGVEFLPAEPGRRVVRVRTVPSPASLISRARALKPGLSALAVVWSLPELRPYVDGLVYAGREAGVDVVSARVAAPDDLPRALRALPTRAQALWVAPDPSIVDAESFVVLSSFARARGLPLYAPLEALRKEGATDAIAPAVSDLGRAAAEAARRVLAGGEVRDEVFAHASDGRPSATMIHQSTTPPDQGGRRR